MRRSFYVWLIWSALSFCGQIYAQQRTMSIHVTDIHHDPIEGVVLSSQGDGSQSPPTDNSGRTLISLPTGARPDDPIFLQLVRSLKANEDWEILSGNQTKVPPFDNKPSSFVTVMLINKFDKQFLANRSYLNSFSNEPRSSEKGSLVLEKNYRTIRPEGTLQAVQAVRSLEIEVVHQKVEVIKATVSMAQAYYLAGRYHESVSVYREALSLQPDDLKILNQYALALTKDNGYPEAELIYERIVKKSDPVSETEQTEMVAILEEYVVVLIKMRREAKVTEVQRRLRNIRAKLTKIERNK